jgi:hypothetical protein
MSMSDKIAANAQPHLDPAEQVQGAFAGQPSVRNRLGEGGYRCVVATDKRFLVFQSGSFSQTALKKLIATAPRDQELGTSSGLWHDLEVGGVQMKVNRRYFKALQQIDALRAAS